MNTGGGPSRPVTPAVSAEATRPDPASVSSGARVMGPWPAVHTGRGAPSGGLGGLRTPCRPQSRCACAAGPAGRRDGGGDAATVLVLGAAAFASTSGGARGPVRRFRLTGWDPTLVQLLRPSPQRLKDPHKSPSPAELLPEAQTAPGDPGCTSGARCGRRCDPGCCSRPVRLAPSCPLCGSCRDSSRSSLLLGPALGASPTP